MLLRSLARMASEAKCSRHTIAAPGLLLHSRFEVDERCDRISKAIMWVLRHGAMSQRVDIEIDNQGWVKIADLPKYKALSKFDIPKIVDVMNRSNMNSFRPRYEISADGFNVREYERRTSKVREYERRTTITTVREYERRTTITTAFPKGGTAASPVGSAARLFRRSLENLAEQTNRRRAVSIEKSTEEQIAERTRRSGTRSRASAPAPVNRKADGAGESPPITSISTRSGQILIEQAPDPLRPPAVVGRRPLRSPSRAPASRSIGILIEQAPDPLRPPAVVGRRPLRSPSRAPASRSIGILIEQARSPAREKQLSLSQRLALLRQAQERRQKVIETFEKSTKEQAPNRRRAESIEKPTKAQQARRTLSAIPLLAKRARSSRTVVLTMEQAQDHEQRDVLDRFLITAGWKRSTISERIAAARPYYGSQHR